jgi:hypothetical protein
VKQKHLLIKLLETIFQNQPTYVGAEIGIDFADTTGCLLRHCLKLSCLYAIDPYPNRDDRAGRTKVLLDGFNDRCKFYRDKSENVADLLPQLDFVFVDGDHSYEGVKIDLEKYVPKIKAGGLLIGHDWMTSNTIKVAAAAGEYLEAHPNLFKPLMTNEQLAEIGLGEFRQGGHSQKLDRFMIYKKFPSKNPLWWVQLN